MLFSYEPTRRLFPDPETRRLALLKDVQNEPGGLIVSEHQPSQTLIYSIMADTHTQANLTCIYIIQISLLVFTYVPRILHFGQTWFHLGHLEHTMGQHNAALYWFYILPPSPL